MSKAFIREVVNSVRRLFGKKAKDDWASRYSKELLFPTAKISLFHATLKPNGRAVKNGELIPGTGNVGPGPFYAGRWCASCNHAHGEAYICISYPEAVIESMIPNWIKRTDYDDVAMMLLDGLSDGADVEMWKEDQRESLHS